MSEVGMNPDPGKSYALADRFVCAQCGRTPEMLSAEGRDPIIVHLRCCGFNLKRAFNRSELVFTQHVFENGSEN